VDHAETVEVNGSPIRLVFVG